MSAPTLYYWGIKARGHAMVLLAAYTGNELNWVKEPDWPNMKGQTLFGQLPHLADGDLQVSQSMAILRYLARKWNVEGKTLADYAMANALTEQATDIYNALAKANYGADKAAGYAKLFSEDIAKLFAPLEALLGGRDSFTETITFGDIAVLASIDTIKDLKADVLAPFPGLQNFYNKLVANEKVAEAIKTPAYFKTE